MQGIKGGNNMSKKKSMKIVIPKEKVYQAEKPRYNPYQTGHGAHKDKTKYSRKKKHKSSWE